ncbi:sensor domain-containing protein (plasmid) [Mycolicibacterium frederiksbergense]|uniref:Sensor domain-containing protein n=1 Tax=Mycolicibacterium frederiksbergense TaxID=117567 RepID=A0A6H0RY35_9MYCO|nr:sensor domain-containing protein [Mycolicibacterium frederiksbergense]
MHEQSTQEAPQFTRPPVQHPPAGSSGWPQTPAAYPAQNQPPAGMAGPPYGASAGGTAPAVPGLPADASPKPSRASAMMNDRRWWAVGGAVVLVAALGGVAFIVNRGDTDATTASPTSTTAAQVPAAPVTTMQPKPSPPAAPPPAPAPPAPTVAADALPGLLLSPDQISQRLNTPGMVPTAVLSNPIPGGVTPANCVTTFVPVAADALNGSGFTGVALQGVALEPAVKAVQGVVAFPDPGAAKAFFDQRSADWSACKSSHITYDDKQDAKIDEIDLGVPAMSGDVMTLEFTSTNSKTANQRCERALTVRGNVVVDTRACAPNVNSAAYDFASDIAAKIK